MAFYADLHLHSKFARATSSDADLEHMALWAAKKGVGVLATGDFTHPGWLAEITNKLVPAEPGLFRLRPDLEEWVAQQLPAAARQPLRFILQVEISTIYKQGDRTRKVHHCIYMPHLAGVKRLVAHLARIGNLKADGRPILGLDSRDLMKITLESCDDAFLIPAHIWTPWFAVLGSKSGFESIAECYADLTPHIFALETGLSSDPPMNWRLSQLDRFQLVSNFDAHSPAKIGREACVFDCALDYFAMRDALRTGRGYSGTVEFFPEEGKYHLDGHRQCGVCCEPEETREYRGFCPTCGKELTVGVMHRVCALADRPEGARSPNAKPFRSLIPLAEVLAEIHRVGPGSRKVADAYEKLVRDLGPELFILEQAPVQEIQKAGSALLAEGIARMRQGRVHRRAGYDGEYGVIRLFTDDELARRDGVSLLFEMPDQEAQTLKPAVSQVSKPAEAVKPEALPTRTHPADLEVGDTANSEICATELPLACDALAGLDPEQRAAAEIAAGPLLIIAGPGTGKTRTLTHRIAYLVAHHGVAPENVLAVTFTNRAATEMKERLHKLLPSTAASISVITFHGLGWRILREHGPRLSLPASFRIASPAERLALLRDRFKLSAQKAARLLKHVSEWKQGAATPANAEVIAANAAFRERGWVDFDDLIAQPVELLEKHPDLREQYRQRFRHVSVDEFQDIDARQYRLVQLLAPTDGSLCVIGDPDQAIYSFRGTDTRFFRQFAADYPAVRTVQLRRNYRSSRAIVQGAIQAIAPSSLVEDRVLEVLNANDTKITIHEAPTDKAEAEFVVHTIEQLIGGSGFFAFDSGRVESSESRSDYAFSDFAVLYRTGAQADTIVEALARSGIPFQRHSHVPLAEREDVQTLLAATRAQPDELPVFDRLKAALENPRSEIRNPKESRSPKAKDESPVASGGSDLGFLSDFILRFSDSASRCGRDLARFESELALLSDADLWDPRADRVSLLTLHASKGLEFPVVFLTGCEDGLLPLRFGGKEDAATLSEERRLFFVGMTRARERLLLTHAKKRLWRGQLRQQPLSPFVTAIEQELLERSQLPALKQLEKPTAAQLDLFGQR